MELIVWINDKQLDDADVGTDLDTKSYKAGDVIFAAPDGWGWTDLELNNTDWQVLQVPDLLQSTADTLMLEGKPYENPDPNTVYPKRAYGIDLTALNQTNSDVSQPNLTKKQQLNAPPPQPNDPVQLTADDLTPNIIAKPTTDG